MRSDIRVTNEQPARAAEVDAHRRALEARVRAAGLEVVVSVVRPAPSLATVWARTRGAGTVASEALAAGRANS